MRGLVPSTASLDRRWLTAASLEALKPNDVVLVYHGTRLAEVFHLVNGFDATTVKARNYGGPRHGGLFVTPSFETARDFASYGPVVLEIAVRAKNLHGTDYSGVTGRQDPRREEIWRDKYPNSFRPYLSLTLLQSHEPQALLQGLVAPSQVKRIWYQDHWHSRKDFLDLGLEAIPAREQPYGQKRVLRDLGIDLSSPRLSYSDFLKTVHVLVGGQTEDRIERSLASMARRGDLAERLEGIGFEPLPAKVYAKRFHQTLLDSLIVTKVARRWIMMAGPRHLGVVEAGRPVVALQDGGPLPSIQGILDRLRAERILETPLVTRYFGPLGRGNVEIQIVDPSSPGAFFGKFITDKVAEGWEPANRLKLPEPCLAPYLKIRRRFKGVGLWVISWAFLNDVRLWKQGIGVAAYEQILKDAGSMGAVVAPHWCQPGGNTTIAAQRVWDSVKRRYNSEGPIVIPKNLKV